MEACNRFKCGRRCAIENTPTCYGHDMCLTQDQDGYVHYYRDDVHVFALSPKEFHALITSILELREKQAIK